MNTCEYQAYGVCKLNNQDCHEEDKSECIKWADRNRWRFRFPTNNVYDDELVSMVDEGIMERVR